MSHSSAPLRATRLCHSSEERAPAPVAPSHGPRTSYGFQRCKRGRRTGRPRSRRRTARWTTSSTRSTLARQPRPFPRAAPCAVLGPRRRDRAEHARPHGAPRRRGPRGPRTVVSGQARFEVLSPTLIRTEYAGDSRFTDGSTFNVVGRDDFRADTFTKTEQDGWLTIDTGAMQVRYEEGSGPFHAGHPADQPDPAVGAARHRDAVGHEADPVLHDRDAVRGRGARAQRPLARHRTTAATPAPGSPRASSPSATR